MPSVYKKWENNTIMDDTAESQGIKGWKPVSNLEKRITFAKGKVANSRTTQLFCNYYNNAFLDAHGFTPVGCKSGFYF